MSTQLGISSTFIRETFIKVVHEAVSYLATVEEGTNFFIFQNKMISSHEAELSGRSWHTWNSSMALISVNVLKPPCEESSQKWLPVNQVPETWHSDSCMLNFSFKPQIKLTSEINAAGVTVCTMFVFPLMFKQTKMHLEQIWHSVHKHFMATISQLLLPALQAERMTVRNKMLN